MSYMSNYIGCYKVRVFCVEVLLENVSSCRTICFSLSLLSSFSCIMLRLPSLIAFDDHLLRKRPLELLLVWFGSPFRTAACPGNEGKLVRKVCLWIRRLQPFSEWSSSSQWSQSLPRHSVWDLFELHQIDPKQLLQEWKCICSRPIYAIKMYDMKKNRRIRRHTYNTSSDQNKGG